MGALTKPDVAGGPVRVLFDNLHELHHRAGWPSLRDMAREVGCSHTTVSTAFAGPGVPRWGLLELIVETLGGDVDRFHRLWLAASAVEPGGGPAAAGQDLAGAAYRSAPQPRQLPADVAAFTGQTDHIAGLDRSLRESGTAVAISVVSGTAGVGKTGLALHWAHRVADQFPDGQLYVDLRGYHPDKPVQPAQALAAFLRGLGVDDSAIPHLPAERAARYRTLLAGRRMLVLLDNARSADQIRDLLPGTSSCFVLVTSRDTLPALVARHGAVRAKLDPLPKPEAVALLRTLIGARVDAEPEQAAVLAHRCARLPLALRIAAELVVARPAVPLTDLVEELRDEHRRLDLLAAGEDRYTALRTVFSWSYRQLGAAAARAFRLLGLHPCGDIDGYAAAALAGTDLADACRLLDVLSRAHLIEEIRLGRFGMHDLLRAYAAELAARSGQDDRRSALTRLFNSYLHTATIAMDAAFPDSRQRRIHVPPPASPTPCITDAADARSWLARERPNLLATAEIAVASGSAYSTAGKHGRVVEGGPSYVSRLAATLAPYLDARAHYEDARSLYGAALEAARADGDRAAEGTALSLLGGVLRRVGAYRTALDQFQRALAIHREVGDRSGEGRTLHGLARVAWRLGRYHESLTHYQQALTVHRDIGDSAGAGSALCGLGIVYRRLGRYHESLAHYQQALTVHRDIGDSAGEGRALCNLGVVRLRLGHYNEATDHFQRSLAIDREIGHRTGQGVALGNLGTAYHRLGRLAEALDHHRQALEIHGEVGYRIGHGEAHHGLGVVHAALGHHDKALDHLWEAAAIGREIGEPELEAAARNDLGAALHAAHRPDPARASYRSALALAEQTGDRYQQAHAFDGLARLCYDAADLPEARHHWQRALVIYTDLGVPEADVIRRRLAAGDDQPDPSRRPVRRAHTGPPESRSRAP